MQTNAQNTKRPKTDNIFRECYLRQVNCSKINIELTTYNVAYLIWLLQNGIKPAFQMRTVNNNEVMINS